MRPDPGSETFVARLLDEAGYRIEGPGHAEDGALRGRFWWTLMRDGWSGIECGPDFESEDQALEDAAAALLADEDLDWVACAVHDHAVGQFPGDFAASMRAWRMSDGRSRCP